MYSFLFNSYFFLVLIFVLFSKGTIYADSHFSDTNLLYYSSTWELSMKQHFDPDSQKINAGLILPQKRINTVQFMVVHLMTGTCE